MIKSSPNFRYLTGNQVTGESSVDGYINALKKGCKCVERKSRPRLHAIMKLLLILSNLFISISVDCWDGEDGEPIIYHGWTLVSKILFKEEMKDAIRKYAFHVSDYPLVLSIENHCSLEQQDKMADQMKMFLG